MIRVLRALLGENCVFKIDLVHTKNSKLSRLWNLRDRWEWPDAIILRNEDWKFLHDRRSREWRNLKFPMSQERYIQISPCWHSRHGETLFPHKRRSRAWGNNFLPYLLCHKWGNLNVPWLTSREFYQSSFLKMIASTFPINKM